MGLKRSIIAAGAGTTQATAAITSVKFQVSNAAAGESIDLTPGNTVIKYSDKTQTVNINAKVGDHRYKRRLLRRHRLPEVGEVFGIVLLDMKTQLATDLGTSKEFTIEVIPPSGVVLYIGRRTPVSLEANMNLN